MSATLRSSIAHAAGWSRRGGPYFPMPAGTLLVIWLALIAIAVAGSAVFGASLSLVLPQWNVWSGAAWLCEHAPGPAGGWDASLASIVWTGFCLPSR